jgi:hypothetical protein
MFTAGSILKAKRPVLIYFCCQSDIGVPNTSIYSAVFLVSPYSLSSKSSGRKCSVIFRYKSNRHVWHTGDDKSKYYDHIVLLYLESRRCRYRSIIFACFYLAETECFRQSRVFQPIKNPVRTLSIFTSMAFVKDANGISFKNRLKGHINWRKVRNFILIWMDESI